MAGLWKSVLQGARGRWHLFAWGLLLAFFCLGYLVIVKLAEPGQHLRALDTIDFLSIFNADDSFRYFIAKQAFLNIDLYAWNYYQPIALFLDGVLLFLVGENISALRIAKLSLGLFSSFLVYLSLQRSDVSLAHARAVVLIALLMPIYVFVLMSFLGEAWLSLFLSLAIFYYLKKDYFFVAIFASVFPLLRVEGFFLLAPLIMYFLLRREYVYCFILLAPGTMYFFWLLIHLESFFDFFRWRVEYRLYTNHIHFPHLYGAERFFITFNALWLSLAVVGCYFCWSRMWPFIVGALVVIGWFVVSAETHVSFYEPRYFVSVMPVLVLLSGIGSSELVKRLGKVAISKAVFSIIFIFIVVNNFLQVDALREKYTGGKRLPFYQSELLSSNIKGYDSERVDAISRVLPVLYELVGSQNHRFDALFLPMQPDFFYILDPDKVAKLNLVMLPVAYGSFVSMFGGSIYGMHPGGRQYSFYNFYSDDRGGQAQLGLYVGDLSSCGVCQPVAASDEFGIYPIYFVTEEEPRRRPPKDELLIVKPASI